MGEINKNDVDGIIEMLDGMCSSGVSRIKMNVSEEEGVSKEYHHGRCDVGSPWAKGTVRNFGNDILDTLDAGCS